MRPSVPIFAGHTTDLMEPQMERIDSDLARMGRAERIREETKRALEYGQSPKRPLSLNANFRVEGLAAVTPPAMEAPGARFLELSRMKVVTSRAENQLLRQETAASLTARIDSELQRLTQDNRQEKAGELLDLVAQLQIADPHGEGTATLHRKVLAAVFGENALASGRDLPKERGSDGRGGSARPHGSEEG